jgi:hypothetical protein
VAGSTGRARWVIHDAVAQALTVLRNEPTTVETARLVLFDDETRAIAERAL